MSDISNIEPVVLTFTVASEEAGMRLDAFLAGRDPRCSRNRYKALIKEGHTKLEAATLDAPNYRVSEGDSITIQVPAPDDPTPEPEAIPLHVVFEDKDLIVVDKPAGLVVHPAVGHWTGTLVNALLHHCGDSLSGIGGVRRPGIVHRLDRDTSGLMVVAKNDHAHRALAEQFADHGRSGALERGYLAFVWRVPQPRAGTIDAPLGRDPRNRLKRAILTRGGKMARTHYRTLQPFGDRASLVSCRLETGRTHQIRIHMASIGHPLIGDAVYGAGYVTKIATLGTERSGLLKRLKRQALHAAELGFVHPSSGEMLRFTSPLPDDLEQVRQALQGL